MTTAAATSGPRAPEGAIVRLDGETYYRIAHVDAMRPFLMNVPSDTDVWMFIASSGGLTAGRVDPDGALFPYETEDRLYDGHHHTGPITLVRVGAGADAVLWRPFADAAGLGPEIERHLYKSLAGNRVVFEEIHRGLALAIRQRWSACDELGLVRTMRLDRLAGGPAEVAVLDGLRNVLAHGAPLALHQQRSSLVDAYKRTEHDPATGLAIFALTTRVIDRPEAAEELRANVVWRTGLAEATVALSDDAIAAFRAGAPVAGERLRTGRRGHYLAAATLRLAAGTPRIWHVVADAARGPIEIAALRARLASGADLAPAIERALEGATERLVRSVASADGLQRGGRPVAAMHHFANVLYNVMRGGVFVDGDRAPAADVADFVRTRNRAVAHRHAAWLDGLSDPVGHPRLIAEARASGDPDLERLALEYLPLHFGRRHGDPSRPWNRFEIRIRRADGTPALHYEGNWRDVFQNWEALAASFPGYLPSMVATFVDASTVDGHNPYRITRDGVDWEVEDPEDPWSSIGYWGDHQIVYLLRLLEALDRADPQALRAMLDRPVFAYANVPYRLAPHRAMRANPHATITFDRALADAIETRVRALGADGRLVAGPDGAIRRATLIEKLLVTALARLSSFVPGGGVWMNTQRPEWNDANNALAGHGVSTVTLCHLRRFLGWLAARLDERGDAPAHLAADVAAWAGDVRTALERHPAGAGLRDDRERAAVLDAVGEAGAAYRVRAYAEPAPASVAVPAAELRALCAAAIAHVDASLALARRPDGLFHAYHVIAPRAGGGLGLEPLEVMLEGQVAALGADLLAPDAAADLIEALFESPLFDRGRGTFMLQPDRELPDFLDKNAVPEPRARAIGLLAALLDAGDGSIIAMDASGTCRFHPDLEQAGRLAARLDALAGSRAWRAAVERDRGAVLDLYEATFRHRAFTGRSGRMYGYEGIGCVYWHMVAKLLLAVQECALAAMALGDPAAERLVRGYFRVRAGLGWERTPGEFGAFPTDPYSHTPRHGGARQPGMTGQVKEEILARFGELGVALENGRAAFRPRLLTADEFAVAAGTWRTYDRDGAPRDHALPAEALAFTWCATPIVYRLVAGAPWVRVVRAAGEEGSREGDTLDAEATRAITGRTGAIERIEVGVPRGALVAP